MPSSPNKLQMKHSISGIINHAKKLPEGIISQTQY